MPSEDQTNPYAAPQFMGIQATADNPYVLALLKKFRSQIHALGAAWMLLGALSIVPFLLAGNLRIGLSMLVLMAVGAAFLAVGLFTCLKQMWAVRLGLVGSYVVVFAGTFLWIWMFVVVFVGCPFLMIVLTIVQAHRVLGIAREIRAAGIPLTTAPSQLVKPAD